MSRIPALTPLFLKRDCPKFHIGMNPVERGFTGSIRGGENGEGLKLLCVQTQIPIFAVND